MAATEIGRFNGEEMENEAYPNLMIVAWIKTKEHAWDREVGKKWKRKVQQ